MIKALRVFIAMIMIASIFVIAGATYVAITQGLTNSGILGAAYAILFGSMIYLLEVVYFNLEEDK